MKYKYKFIYCTYNIYIQYLWECKLLKIALKNNLTLSNKDEDV